MIEEYLKTMVEVTKSQLHRKNSLKFCCIEDFVLQNGYLFTEKTIVKKKDKMGMCFRNAYHYASDNNLIYVEGYATISTIGIAMIHAWCIDKTGVVYDSTWKDKGTEYFGVPFDMRYINKTLLKKGTFGLLENWEQGFPLLKGMKGFKNRSRILLNYLERRR